MQQRLLQRRKRREFLFVEAGEAFGFGRLHYFANFLLLGSLPGGRKFSPVTTDLPVLASSARRACLAIVPPLAAATLFSVIPVASSVSAICRVDNSASAVKISSRGDNNAHVVAQIVILQTLHRLVRLHAHLRHPDE